MIEDTSAVIDTFLPDETMYKPKYKRLEKYLGPLMS